MFDNFKKLFEPPPPSQVARRSQMPRPAPPPLTAEEQAVHDKVLYYPLVSWNTADRPKEILGSSASTTLRRTNPSGSTVDIVHNVGYSVTFDERDQPTTHTNSTYVVRVDGHALDNLSQRFLGSLYGTLKGRIEGDPAYRKRLQDEAKAREAARAVAEEKARKALYDKL